jgi:hypothetical protein
MKILLTSLILVMSFMAQAGEITKAARQAAKAMGLPVSVSKYKPAHTEKLLFSFLNENYKGYERSDVKFNNDDFQMADEITYGTTSYKAARAWIYSIDDNMGNESSPERKSDMKKAEKALQAAKAAGAKFGYAGNSSSACGMIYTGILVFDEKSGEVTEIAPFEGGEC